MSDMALASCVLHEDGVMVVGGASNQVLKCDNWHIYPQTCCHPPQVDDVGNKDWMGVIDAVVTFSRTSLDMVPFLWTCNKVRIPLQPGHLHSGGPSQPLSIPCRCTFASGAGMHTTLALRACIHACVALWIFQMLLGSNHTTAHTV